MKWINKYLKFDYIISIIAIVLVGFALFYKLEDLPIRLWDESRLAISAIEMMNNNNFLVVHFEGLPEMWSTKPPLMIWMQVICLKIFGVRELSIRLPATISALIICIGFIRFFKKEFSTVWIGIISAFLFISSKGLIENHASRSGDYDVPLTMFMFFAAIYFYKYIENEGDKRSNVFLTTIFLALASLTKGIVPLIMLPAFLIYVAIRKKFKLVLSDKNLYISLLIYITPVFGYYFLREIYNPGYLQAVWDTELGGRYNQTRAGHQHPFTFYLYKLTDYAFTPWYILYFLSPIFYYSIKEPKIRNILIFNLLISLWFWLIISLAKTKLPWYSIPMYVFMIMNSAIVIYYIVNLLELNNLKRKIVFIVSIICLFSFSYINLIKSHLNQTNIEIWRSVDYYKFGHFIKLKQKNNRPFEAKTFVYSGYNPQCDFYKYFLKERGVHINFIKLISDIPIGESILFYDKKLKTKIEKYYKLKFIGIKNFGTRVECYLVEKDSKGVNGVIESIKKDSTYMKIIEEKANKRNVSVEDMIYKDAIWIMNQ